MDLVTRALDALSSAPAKLKEQPTLVGFDGFVDSIVTPVALREGPGELFTPFGGMAQFGQLIVGAAGKSLNLELYPRRDKLGGNGPIMGLALAALGCPVTGIGGFGRQVINPVFDEYARKADLVSLCDPAHTLAVEFPDGKLMLGMMRSLDEISPAAIESALDGPDGYRKRIEACKAVALTNWTMIPALTAIYDHLTREILPGLKSGGSRLFFFDLCDPEKRSREDLSAALQAIARFSAFGEVILGLNLREAEQIAAVLGLDEVLPDEAGLQRSAAAIRAQLAVTAIVIHPRESAACATAAGTAWVLGPYVAKPLITTGAGDHFNAGFVAGWLLGSSPDICLLMGVSTSGYYVRTGRSPGAPELSAMVRGQVPSI